MTWLQRYRVRHYFEHSVWILPVCSMFAALVTVRLLLLIDRSMGWQSGFLPETARTTLGTMASSMFSFIVFVTSALLVAIQLASAQLSPRIIAIVFRDPVMRFSLTLFTFVFTLVLGVLLRVENSVPLLSAHTAAYSSLACLGVFLFMIDHVGKSLRPSGALSIVATLGQEAIENVYPRRF